MDVLICWLRSLVYLLASVWILYLGVLAERVSECGDVLCVYTYIHMGHLHGCEL